MRYARGMFRLWLVASCLWIAIVANITYSNWPTPSSTPNYYVPEFMKDPDTGKPLPEFVPDPNILADQKPTDYSKFLPYQKPDQNTYTVSTQQLLVSATKLALVPPALIFVVGIGLTWALRGFRPR